MKQLLLVCFALLSWFPVAFAGQIPTATLVQIVKAEDERRYDAGLENLLKNPNEKIRVRAALAAGRIGDERALPALVNLLEKDSSPVQMMAAFAIGEIESVKGAEAIIAVLKNRDMATEVRARAVEAAGKIAAAVAQTDKPRAEDLGAVILSSLDDENVKPKPDVQMILLGLTAVLRARPANGEFIAAKFLVRPEPRVRADAANTLARLRAKNANEQFRKMLSSDTDPVARANAARALGAAEDKTALDLLLNSAINDSDERVRVSAIRALASLKDARAADALLSHGENLFANYKKSNFSNPIEKNELLELAAALGRLLLNSNNQRATDFLVSIRDFKADSPEIEIAMARIDPKQYAAKAIYTPSIKLVIESANSIDWRSLSSIAQGYGEIANLERTEANAAVIKDAEERLRIAILNPKEQQYTKAIPDLLRAFAAFKTTDLPGVLLKYLNYKDVVIRATAAELLGEQPQQPTADSRNVQALNTAFVQSLVTDTESNDAQLAILPALVKLDKKASISSLMLALDAPDYLLRRQAVQLIKQNNLQGEFPGLKNPDDKIGKVAAYTPRLKSKLGVILNTNADYLRAVSRRSARALVGTEKGIFEIEFFPEDAPLAVDNFIKLARSGYFDNVSIHRVVPNFVMQDGDPRGDGNGGPGWQIRCEINEFPYERGAVGMALSGKDTGGSQWFVTHSRQPHLDGGYTVFGQVNSEGMKIIDDLVRGDKILSVKIVEGNPPPKAQRKPRKRK